MGLIHFPHEDPDREQARWREQDEFEHELQRERDKQDAYAPVRALGEALRAGRESHEAPERRDSSHAGQGVGPAPLASLRASDEGRAIPLRIAGRGASRSVQRLPGSTEPRQATPFFEPPEAA